MLTADYQRLRGSAVAVLVAMLVVLPSCGTPAQRGAWRRRNGDGTTEIRGRLADSVVDRLTAYLESLTNPRRQTPCGTPFGDPSGDPADRRPYDERLGLAFAAFLESIDPGRLPLHGGDATTVLVTIDLEVLRQALGGTALIGDDPITAAQARRLACMGDIIPVVLGGDSEILDLGRRRRLFTPAQRKAMALRDRSCRAEGCDIPAAWCEAHHAATPWAQGGKTDLADGALLCNWHHHRAHDHRYHARRHPDGQFNFHRRT